jgi:hypothetical protein
LDPELVFRVVADYYELEEGAFGRRYDRHLGRALAAWLCRRHTEATLCELAERLGLARAESVPNLTRRVDEALRASPALAGELAEITKRLESPSYYQGGATKTTKN